MSKDDLLNLSKRERQIMEVVYHRGRATAAEITEALADPPSHSAVRALIRILESKGHLKHRKEGIRHVYLPTRSPRAARRTALKKVVETFFGGSVEQAVSALLSEPDIRLTDEELNRLSKLINKERKEGLK